MTAPVTVTRDHLRTVPGFGMRSGFCGRGARRWFARHGLDWTDFLRNGISSDVLERTGDAMALALVAHAREVRRG